MTVGEFRPKNKKPMAEPRLAISLKKFRGLMEGFGFRLREDDEGTPIVLGRYGRIEWHSFNNETLAIYSDRKFNRLFAESCG